MHSGVVEVKILGGVRGGMRGCVGCILRQKRLTLSWEVDKCKPLPRTRQTSSPAARRGAAAPAAWRGWGTPEFEAPHYHITPFIQRGVGPTSPHHPLHSESRWSAIGGGRPAQMRPAQRWACTACAHSSGGGAAPAAIVSRGTSTASPVPPSNVHPWSGAYTRSRYSST